MNALDILAWVFGLTFLYGCFLWAVASHAPLLDESDPEVGHGSLDDLNRRGGR